jgi:RNA polymerase sigma-70 factor (ECF subfamily)
MTPTQGIRMSHNTPQSPFSIRRKGGDDYATWYIKRKTDELVGHFGIAESDRADIEQELALDLVQRWPKFDPGKSKPRTFITQVVRHKVSTIIRHRSTEQRRFEQIGHVPIDRSIEEEVPRCFRTGLPERIDQEYVDLSEDVAAVLAKLPAELRNICKQLRTESIAEVARQLGIPASTLRYRIRKIRGQFEEDALQDYL